MPLETKPILTRWLFFELAVTKIEKHAHHGIAFRQGNDVELPVTVHIDHADPAACHRYILCTARTSQTLRYERHRNHRPHRRLVCNHVLCHGVTALLSVGERDR